MPRAAHMRVAALALALSLAGLAASQERPSRPASEPEKKPAKAAGKTSVKILSPRPGQIFKSDEVPVRLRFVKRTARDHLVQAYVDGKLRGGFQGEKGTLHGIAPGRHTLEVRLSAVDQKTDLNAAGKVSFVVEYAADAKDRPKAPARSNPERAREVEKVVRAIFIAYNSRNVDAFLAGWTEYGLQETFGESKESAKRAFPYLRGLSAIEPIAVGAFSNTVVDDEWAGTDVELSQNNVKKSRWLSLVRKDNAWRIDGSKESATRIPPGVTAVPVMI